MSEMFTKIGGYIASGDPLVYADSATMTGDGTVASPFGIKASDLYVQEPLFTGTSGTSAYIGWKPDETVLWSGNYVSGSQITAAENLTNFEWIRFDLETNDGYQRPYLFSPSSITGAENVIAFTDGNVNASTFWQKWVKYRIADNLLSAIDGHQWKIEGNTITNSTINQFTLHQIIGINRKPEA